MSSLALLNRMAPCTSNSKSPVTGEVVTFGYDEDVFKQVTEIGRMP